jgi:NTP pyrophosphatase (non-canonical NTP hydrolase)
MDSKRVLSDAIETFGFEKQSLVLIEEMAELTQAIVKQRRESDDFFFSNSMLEEMADVQIMLDQMHLALNHPGVVKYNYLYFQKIRRLADILGTDVQEVDVNGD